MTVGLAGYGRARGWLKSHPEIRPLAADHRREQRNVPPVEEYQAWLDSRPARGAAHKIDACMVRRLVIALRGGESFAEMWLALGKPISRDLFKRMPDHLK